MDEINFGRVKFYAQEKGYGIIRRNDGEEYFFHFTNVNDMVGGEYPRHGDEVYFMVSHDQKKHKDYAHNVTVVRFKETEYKTDGNKKSGKGNTCKMH